MIQTYTRCTGGHYYIGTHCPIDGWSIKYHSEVNQALESLRQRGVPVSIAQLRLSGVPDEALKRIIVIELGDPESSFECLVPFGYVVDGVWAELDKVKVELL